MQPFECEQLGSMLEIEVCWWKTGETMGAPPGGERLVEASLLLGLPDTGGV